MKKIISATLVLAIVGSALAFKKDVADIRFCDNDGFCKAQALYSTVDPGTGIKVDPGQAVFTGNVGALCGSAQCPSFPRTLVYENE